MTKTELVRVVSRTTVRLPQSETPDRRRIGLTPWDLHMLLCGHSQKGIAFLLQEKPSQLIIDHLKTSFSRTLQFFPLLAGRLHITNHSQDDTCSVYVDCNNAGAEFVHAVADNVKVADVIDKAHVPQIIHYFFQLTRFCNHQGTYNPLLSVQVTELDDGFFLGCTMNHAVVDGTSFWMFLNSWSEISRGAQQISLAPSFDRSGWNNGNIGPATIRLPLDLILPSQSSSSDDENHEDLDLPDLDECVFHFSREQIQSLKAKANAETTLKISSLQALLAHVWHSVVRCRADVGNERQMKLNVLIGVRPRWSKPPLPEGYFGNAIYTATVTATARELRERGLGWTAGEINKVIASQTEEAVKNLYKSWTDRTEMFKSEALIDDYSIIVASSPTFNVYGNDFGWGKPVAVRYGVGTKSNGKLTVFQGADEQGSIDVLLKLRATTLSALGDDKEFMKFTT